ncbi:MAG: hypothetical protein RJQ00_07280 [Vicingaceae bacterium]
MKDTLIGLTVGVVIGVLMWIIYSPYFEKWQKIILYITTIFPPAQWILIAVFYFWNKNANQAEFKVDKLVEDIENLKMARERGLINEDELKKKLKIIETEQESISIDEYVKTTEDYKVLKNLLKKELLTQQEFEKKIELLKSKLDFKKSINQKKEKIIFSDLSIAGNWENNKFRLAFKADNQFEYYDKVENKKKKGSYTILEDNEIWISYYSLFKGSIFLKIVDVKQNWLKYKIGDTLFELEKVD